VTACVVCHSRDTHDAAAIFPDCVDGEVSKMKDVYGAHISNEQVLKITAYVVLSTESPIPVKLLKRKLWRIESKMSSSHRHGRRYACWFPYCFWGPCLPVGKQPIIAICSRIAAQTGCRRGRGSS